MNEIKEFNEMLEEFKDTNPWMNDEEAREATIEYFEKHDPDILEAVKSAKAEEKKPDFKETPKPSELCDTEDFPVWIFDIYTNLDCILMLSNWLQAQDSGLCDRVAVSKANDIFSRVRRRYFIGDMSIPRDLEAEAMFIKAIVEPYQQENAKNTKNSTPAVVATVEPNSSTVDIKVESNPAEQEANFDPTNPALGYFQQYPVNPMFAQPIHKVDEPPKAPKPVPPEDNVQSNLNRVNFGGLVKPAPIQQVPEVIGHKLANPEMVIPVTENICNNDIIISKFPKIPLKQIEQIANANGVSVMFEEYPWTNLISVTALDSYGQAVAPKCFVIDTGMIIDPRAKLIATNPKINPNVPLEFAQMFELFVIDTKNHNRKLLDEKLINDIFIGGLLNISKKEMYSAEYKKLNTKVALITMPTKGITKEMRNALQEYLMKMDEHGDFDKAISMSPNGCRFVFNTDRLDRDHLSDFSMINEGVPLFYGTPAPVVNPTIIESKDGKVSIRAGRT